MSELTEDFRIKRIQRWIGVPETGAFDLETIQELEKDVVGLHDYLQSQQGDSVVTTPDLSTPVLPAPPPTPVAGYNEVSRPSPNFTSGRRINSIGVLLHASYGSLEGTLSWITQRKSQVSYHVVIGKDGTRYNVVDLDRRAWHAGKSSFRGRYGCNNFMVGVSFSENTYDRDLTDDELASLEEFVILNKDKYGWTLDGCTDHRTVAPHRKVDINPKELARARNVLKRAFAA